MNIVATIIVATFAAGLICSAAQAWQDRRDAAAAEAYQKMYGCDVLGRRVRK
jgi:hypothetical protein